MFIYMYINVYIYILYTIWVWKFENICQFMIINTNFYNEIYIKYLLWQKIFGLYLKYFLSILIIIVYWQFLINILLNQFLSLICLIDCKEIQSQNRISINKNCQFYIERINYRIYID